MSYGDAVVIFVLAVVVGFIIGNMLKNKKKGSVGCSGCSGCAGCGTNQTCHCNKE